MKLPCAVVRDLLPLFAENMTEPETETLIKEHLPECPACRQKYNELQTGASAVPNTEADPAAPLRTLKKELRRRRLFAALIAGLLVFVVGITIFYRAESLMPLSWEEGLVTVKGVEEITPENRSDHPYLYTTGSEPASPREYTGNALILNISGPIAGIETEHIEEDGTVTVLLQGYGRSSAFGRNLSGPVGEMILCPVPDRLIYGYEDPQELLWGEPLNGGVQVLPRLALTYYVLIAALAAALSGFLWLLFRKKPWSRILRQIFFAPLSYILAHFLIMDLRPISFSITRDLCFIVLTACALYALISLLWQALQQKRKAAQIPSRAVRKTK